MSQNLRWSLKDYAAYRARRALKERSSAVPVGTVQGSIGKQSPQPALDSDSQAKRPRKARLVGSVGPVARVHLIAFRHRLIEDKDNLIGGCKGIRDCVAASLGLDDADKFIEWEYGQQQTRGQEGVLVSIERLPC